MAHITKNVVVISQRCRVSVSLRNPSSDCLQDSMQTLFIWGFPQIRGTILGVPTLRIVQYIGVYIGVT